MCQISFSLYVFMIYNLQRKIKFTTARYFKTYVPGRKQKNKKRKLKVLQTTKKIIKNEKQ